MKTHSRRFLSLVTIVMAAFVATVGRAQALTAKIIAPTKMELTKGKGTILLSPGTEVDVVSQEGGSLTVFFRKVAGVVPLAQTDFKGEVPKTVQATSAPQPTAPAAKEKPAAPSPAERPPAASSSTENPSSNYGKMLKKARDNEAKHKENLVDGVENSTK